MSVPTPRRHDLDWLRALAILALVFFHSAMPYVAEWDWHIRNSDTSALLLEFNFFVSRFRMAVLFVVAGVAIHLVLTRRSLAAFLRDRARRLLVPLMFGVLVVVPPQIYVERVADGTFTGSFLAFWPRTLRLQPYPLGDTSYHHLWFIFYLFLYSVLLIPLVAYARTPHGVRTLQGFRRWLGSHGVHALAIPIVLTYASLVRRYSGSQNVVDDVAMFLVYLQYLVVGWLVGTDGPIWSRLVAGRQRAFSAALVAWLAITAVRWSDAEPASGVAAWAWLSLLGAHAWCWVTAILGYGHRWLNRDHPVLRWARDISYPVYVIHQTVIVVVAAHVVRTPEPVLAKFLFTSVVSLLVTLAITEVLVRPSATMRWLFGMPAGARDDAGTAPPAATTPVAAPTPSP